MTLADKLAGMNLRQIMKEAKSMNKHPDAGKKVVSKSRQVRVVDLYKSHPFAELLGMTSAEITEALSGISPAGLLILIQGLATELRRLNALAADGEDPINGPNAQADLSAGESNAILGLSKSQRTRVASIVERTLEGCLRVHDEWKAGREAQLGKSRNVPRTLDELEAWGQRQARIAAAVEHSPDEDGGASALGLSKLSQKAAGTIEKSGAMLPGDSYNGQVDVAEQMQKQQSEHAEVHKTEAQPPHWSQRGRGVRKW